MPTNSSNKKELVCITNKGIIYKSEFEDNKFPLEVFPQALTDLNIELNEIYGFPIEFCSGSALVAFATAIGNTIQLKLKRGFIVKSNLYCLLCGSPGTCKSHPISFFFKPIRDREAMYKKEFQDESEEYNFYEKMSKKEKECLPPATKPKQRINILDNFTLESMMKTLSENPRGISIVVDELASFFGNMSRYASGSDSETYNTLWSGLPTSVNRVSTDHCSIPDTAISIFGTIQPEVLNSIFSKGNDKNGLTARFLFIMPENLLPLKWTKEDINNDLYEQYYKAIQKILDVELQIDENGIPVPTIIDFTEEALERIIKWQSGEEEYYGESLAETGNTYYDALRKFDTYVLRFALILQIMYASFDNEPQDKVGIRAVENAILLVNYFKKEVIKVHQFLYKKDIRVGMSKKQREVYEILPPEFYLNQTYDKVGKLGFTKDQLKKFVGIAKYFTRIGHGKYSKNFSEFSDE